MPEILTESFCERCGTRYTFEAAEPKGKRLGKLKVLSKGFVNFVSNDETSFDEAFAEARNDEQRELTNQQLDAFHQTFQFCMSCRQYTCANCWNEAESRCLSCAPHLGTDILQAPFPSLDPLARIFNAPSDVGLNGNGHANGERDGEPGGGPVQTPEAAWPTTDLGGSATPILALPAGSDEADALAADTPTAEAPTAEALAADAAAAGASVDDDVAQAVEAAEQARRTAALAEAERERAETEAVRQAAESAERAAAERAAAEQVEAAAQEAERAALAERAEAASHEAKQAEAERAREAARIEAEGAARAQAVTDAAEQERRAAAEATEAEARARTEEAERERQVAADAAAERERKVAAEAERQRVAFEDQERARQAAALAAAASVAPPPPPARPEADRAAATAAQTNDLLNRFRPGHAQDPGAGRAAGGDRDDRVGSPNWQIVAPDPTASPTAAPSNGAGPDWPSPLTTPPPQWPMPAANGQSVNVDLWAASSREVAGAAAPTGVQACLSCGLPLSANARFCRRCGTQQH
jgi:ribosomal protein L40E